MFKSKARKQAERDAEVQKAVQAALEAKEEAERLEAERQAQLAKEEEERLAKEAEEKAKIEPRIDVTSVDFESGDPRQGSFELDWNEQFVEWLRLSGYAGKEDEQVVDLWFQDMCKNVAMETWEQYDADPTNRSIVTKEDIGDGRTSVS